MREPLSAEAVLVTCPVCEAWPMVVSFAKIIMVLASNANIHLPKMPF